MAYPLARRSQAYEQWLRFCREGVTQGVRDCIKASWLRCREHGLDPKAGSSAVSVSLPVGSTERTPQSVKQLVASHYQAIESRVAIPFTFLFIDAEHTIRHMYGNEKILDRFSDHSVRQGKSVYEKFSGTNAPALSLIEKKPVVVSAEEHFFKDFHWARCLALPVLDHQQNVAGSLCMTTDVEYQWTIGKLSEYLCGLAHSLGFHLFIEEKARRLEIQEFYFRSTFERADQVMLLVNQCGDIMALNWAAQRLLGLLPSMAFSKNVRELIQIPQEDRSLSCLTRSPEFVKLRARANNKAIFSMDTIPITGPASENVAFILRLVPEKSYKALHGSLTSPPGSSFGHVVATAPKTVELLYKAKRAAKTSSSVLIEGETGTGKELLAQAIHYE
ncbi:MAG: sigma 54-interacting transcriptional regulator, partial [Deltaproteobacteria bacterium]